MKTDIHLQVIPMPSAQDREKALALAIQWHEGYDPPLDAVLTTARRFAAFIADGHVSADAALPVPAPVERGPAHDPPQVDREPWGEVTRGRGSPPPHRSPTQRGGRHAEAEDLPDLHGVLRQRRYLPTVREDVGRRGEEEAATEEEVARKRPGRSHVVRRQRAAKTGTRLSHEPLHRHGVPAG